MGDGNIYIRTYSASSYVLASERRAERGKDQTAAPTGLSAFSHCDKVPEVTLYEERLRKLTALEVLLRSPLALLLQVLLRGDLHITL